MKLSRHEKIFCALAALFVTVLLISSFLPLFGRMTPRAHEANAVAAIKNVLRACRAYAADHDDGAYPPNLAALVPDYLDDATPLFVDNGSGEELPLLYFPGFHSDSDPGAIL